MALGDKPRYAAFHLVDGAYKFAPEGFPADVLQTALSAPAEPAAQPQTLPGGVLVRFRLTGFEDLSGADGLKPIEPAKDSKDPAGKVTLADDSPVEGKHAARIEYFLKPGQANGLEGRIGLPGQPQGIAIAIREEKEAAGKVLWLTFESADGQKRYATVHLEQTKPAGWTQNDVALGLGGAEPLWALSRIEVSAGADKTQGTLCLDDLRLTTSVEPQEVQTLKQAHPALEVLPPAK